MFILIDPLRSLNDLLRQCIVDFDEIYSFHNSWQKSLENSLSNQCSQVYLNATNHLNGIVTLSSRVFFQLQSADSNLRQPTLTAVYRVWVYIFLTLIWGADIKFLPTCQRFLPWIIWFCVSWWSLCDWMRSQNLFTNCDNFKPTLTYLFRLG